ncbi:MAG: glycosyl hydrolase family 18 protein [Candidatus Pelethousia sp.]|nr:glycosyl hydrolase family 18 protein [Candidatus Pelethousia sp.]
MRTTRWAAALLSAALIAALFTACAQQALLPYPPGPMPDAEAIETPGTEAPSTGVPGTEVPGAEVPGAEASEAAASPALPQAHVEAARHLSAWAVYWDTGDVIAELEALGAEEQLEALCYFEAFFDSRGSLVLPEGIPPLYQAVQARFPAAEWTSYLTFVNDLQDDAGQFSLKDTGLLWALLGTDEALFGHVESVIALAKAQGFDGVEIDYESIRKDFDLWERFFAFCSALYTRTQEEGLALRVLVEPNTPFESLAFPPGPTYVMMCYNLHGSHSGPGPKADAAFIQKLIAQMAALPGRKDFAIATGGYDWCKDEAKQLTEEAAVKLAAEHRVSPKRDAANRALSFLYNDEAGRRHEVWYADRETLDSWAAVIRENGGEGISIWRLGGNLNAAQWSHRTGG